MNRIRACSILLLLAAAVLLPYSLRAQSQVRRLDVLIVLYTRSFAHVLTAAELERVQEEVVEFADFYQQHGGDRVDIRFTLLQLDRTLRRAEVSEVQPGRYYLSRENVEAELAALGFRGRFDEVVAFYAWNNANADAAVLAYGGGAVGPDGRFLGDAGFNSIGVFAWDPARIAQVAVHEVLHNVDDMFSRSGMADAFFNSDEMSRNMATLLRERPGAFQPYFSDREMLAYAEREQAGKEMYPWWLQRIYYGWMLERTPASAWGALRYGRMSATRPAHTPRPLYDAVYVSRATPRIYLPVLDATGPVDVRGAARPLRLQRLRYALEDFDGTPLVERPYDAGWIDLAPDSLRELRFRGVGTGTRVHRLRLGDIVAPAEVVSYSDDRPATFRAALREAGWPKPGDTLNAQLSLTAGARTIAPARSLGRAHEFELPRGELRGWLTASADSFLSTPAPIAIAARPSWSVHAPRSLEGTLGTPLGLRVPLRDDRPLTGAVSARTGHDTLTLQPLPDGDYFAQLPPLAPGLQHVAVGAVRSDGRSFTDTVLVYGRPSGWIRVPTALRGQAGRPLAIEVSVRSRMGEPLRGLHLPLVATVNALSLPLHEDPATGTYRANVPLPPGDHRIFVTSLEGDFQRRVILAHVDGISGTAPAFQGGGSSALHGADGPLPYAAANRLTTPPRLDGALTEWEGEPLQLAANAHLLTDPAQYHGTGDASAELWLAWDDSTLYLAGRVRDDRVTHGEAWDRDRVNLVFDWRENDTPLTYGEDGAADVADWQSDDQWLFFQPFWSDSAAGVPRRMDRTGTHPLPEARLASRRTATGYTFELAVPASALPEYAPYIGGVSAMQIFLTDGDDEPGTTELMWSHQWHYTADGGLLWELPRMGRLLFTDAVRR